jgi:hypothetical protein
VMGMGLRTCAGSQVRVEQVQVRATKMSPVTYPYPFGQVTGCDINLASSHNCILPYAILWRHDIRNGSRVQEGWAGMPNPP